MGPRPLRSARDVTRLHLSESVCPYTASITGPAYVTLGFDLSWRAHIGTLRASLFQASLSQARVRRASAERIAGVIMPRSSTAPLKRAAQAPGEEEKERQIICESIDTSTAVPPTTFPSYSSGTIYIMLASTT